MEKPILFSGAMVRALLDGRKTQTRRVVTHKYEALKKAPYYPTGKVLTNLERQPGAFMEYRYEGQAYDYAAALVPCPYGQPGDRLWVRETWRGIVDINPPDEPLEFGVARYVPEQKYCRHVEYLASQPRDGKPWRPSIHMPRWASRILLEITAVRVERLQDISEEDAVAEGIQQHGQALGWASECRLPDGKRHFDSSAYGMFRQLWESLKPPAASAWNANPWVWVVEFKRVTP